MLLPVVLLPVVLFAVVLFAAGDLGVHRRGRRSTGLRCADVDVGRNTAGFVPAVPPPAAGSQEADEESDEQHADEDDDAPDAVEEVENGVHHGAQSGKAVRLARPGGAGSSTI